MARRTKLCAALFGSQTSATAMSSRTQEQPLKYYTMAARSMEPSIYRRTSTERDVSAPCPSTVTKVRNTSKMWVISSLLTHDYVDKLTVSVGGTMPYPFRVVREKEQTTSHPRHWAAIDGSHTLCGKEVGYVFSGL